MDKTAERRLSWRDTILPTMAMKLRLLGIAGTARRAMWILRREGIAGVVQRMRRWRQNPASNAGTQLVVPGHHGGANLVGHPFGALGMGEHIRKSSHAFAAAGVPFVLVNTFNQVGSYADKYPEFPYFERITRDNPYPVSVFHMNADEMPLASAYLGEGFFKDRYNIGYWAWELSKFPDAWSAAFDFFDEVWAPSRFIQQALADKTTKPVIHMPLAVEFASDAPMSRTHFGLPHNKFLFLFYFDFTSYVTRKNPYATLRAFRTAFESARLRGDPLIFPSRYCLVDAPATWSWADKCDEIVFASRLDAAKHIYIDTFGTPGEPDILKNNDWWLEFSNHCYAINPKTVLVGEVRRQLVQAEFFRRLLAAVAFQAIPGLNQKGRGSSGSDETESDYRPGAPD